MTDTFWIILGVSGALSFVYLLANKWSRRIEEREQDELDKFSAVDDEPQHLGNKYFYDRWSQ